MLAELSLFAILLALVACVRRAWISEAERFVVEGSGLWLWRGGDGGGGRSDSGSEGSESEGSGGGLVSGYEVGAGLGRGGWSG